MDYSKLIRDSYQTTFQHKRMWWLGMAVLTGSTVGGRLISTGIQEAISFSDNTELSNEIALFFNSQGMQDWWADSWWLVLVIVGLLFVLWIVAILTHLVAQSGLYFGAQQARLGQPVKFGAMCAIGVKTIWRYFGFYILLAIARFLAGLAFFISFISLLASIIGVIVAVPIIFAVMMLSWVLAIVIEVYVIFCLQGMTLNQYSSWDTFYQAWMVLRKNYLESILTAVLVILIKGALGLASFFLYLILVSPFAILVYVAYTSEAWLMFILSLVIGSLVIFSIRLLLKGMVQSFYAHLWHRLYASF